MTQIDKLKRYFSLTNAAILGGSGTVAHYFELPVIAVPLLIGSGVLFAGSWLLSNR
jgi:hypothetical protein